MMTKLLGIMSTDFDVTDRLVYMVSQEESKKLRKSVPYVKLYRYNPKHLYPKLNGYRENGQRKVWSSCEYHVVYLHS